MEVPLDQWLAEARLRWPDLVVPDDAFAEWVHARLEPGLSAPRQPVAAHAADLYLACACARGDPAAIRTFRATYRGVLERIFRAPRGPGKDAEDLAQLLMARLFVAEEGHAPRIVEYRGRGPLRTWLRVVAMRVRLNAERGRRRPETSLATPVQARLADDWDAELEYMKRGYRAAFKAAFAEALAELEPRERALLRLHVCHGLSATGIAGVFSVHRATAKRWLATTRERLLGSTRDRMRERLRVDGPELEDVMGLIGSRLEASVRRCLEESVLGTAR